MSARGTWSRIVWLTALAMMPVSPVAWADQPSALLAARTAPRAVDAQMDTSGSLYVLVKPENLPWGQYAAGMCDLVRPHQARIFRVRIIDLTQAKGKAQGTWPRLAEAACG